VKLLWHREAKAEAEEATAFYFEKQPALAQRFLDDLESALHGMRRHPESYRRIEGDVRKCKVPHFPYGVIYRVRSNYIEIIAVMHLRRRPRYWKERGT